MKLKTLLEMTQPQAVDIFAKHGERLGVASADEVKKARNRLVRRYQADLINGGDSVLKQINAAYDVLKHGVQAQPASRSPHYRDFSQDATPRQEEPQGTPRWAWAGHSGGIAPSAKIHRDDFTDSNFILKTMWELSGKSNEEWTIHGFDGHFFRGILTVYGNDKIFDKMAEAMHTWQTRGGNSYSCRAVLVTNKSLENNEMWLIYADGVVYADDPPRMHHDSFNSNPGNDKYFTAHLTRYLNDLKNGTK